MARKRARSSHWLNQHWWRFALAEWIGLSLSFLGIVLLFCLFFIRRQTLEYQFEHTFAVRDPEFFGSALALCDPLPLAGNKIELLANGDESKGKKLSFIIQEIGREINTTGSKAYDADIQKCVVKMKDELEKAKEQVLNVL